MCETTAGFSEGMGEGGWAGLSRLPVSFRRNGNVWDSEEPLLDVKNGRRKEGRREEKGEREKDGDEISPPRYSFGRLSERPDFDPVWHHYQKVKPKSGHSWTLFSKEMVVRGFLRDDCTAKSDF